MRPGIATAVVLALLAASCASPTASESGADDWQFAIPSVIGETPLHRAVTEHVEASLAADSLVPATCVDQLTSQVTDILFADLSVPGLMSRGVTEADASAVGTNAFFESLPIETRGRVVGALAGCKGLALRVSLDIPGVSAASLTCLVDSLSTSGFFEKGLPDAGPDPTAALDFAGAKAACLDQAEQLAFDSWSILRLTAPSRVRLAQVECVAIDPAPFSAVLGFDIDEFEPSAITADTDRPVGCAFGDPDGDGPWVTLYAATRDSQLVLYREYEPTIPEFAEVWVDLTDILEYAGVLYIAAGGNVEWFEGAVTATFEGGDTSAARTAGSYILMVSAGPGGGRPPLSRAELAVASDALAASLALS